MSEPIIEQIADWINDALDGVTDTDGTFTLRSIRPTILDWSQLQLIHGDVIIELGSIETVSRTASSRTEEAMFKLNGIITELAAGVKADTVLARFAETIRKTILAGNTSGTACGGLAVNIDCPAVDYEPIEGGVCTIVTCRVRYFTNYKDGYLQS